MSISKLETLVETSFEDFPDESIKHFIKEAVEDHKKLRTLFSNLLKCKVISEGVLLADPAIYNKMVKIFNK